MCTWPVDASRKGNGSGGSTRCALGLLMLAERGMGVEVARDVRLAC